MKKSIATLAVVIALFGFVGLTGAMAATPNTRTAACCAPGYTNYIGAPSSCPTMDAVGANTPSIFGAVGF